MVHASRRRPAAVTALSSLLWVLACDRGAAGIESAPTATAAAVAVDASEPPVASAPSQAVGSPLSPVVALDGATHPHPVTLVAPGHQRIYSRAPRTWIYAEPNRRAARLGYLRAGGSAPTVGEPRAGNRCAGGYVRILPRGFICVDRRTTFDANDPVVRVFAEHPPDFTRRLPYLYGTVRNPGPVYAGVPSSEELRELEPDFEERYPRWLTAEGEIGAGYAQDVWLSPGESLVAPQEAWQQQLTRGVPSLLRGAGVLPGFSGRLRDRNALLVEQMRPKVGYGLLETFLAEGRRYGVTTRLQVLPTDRLRPIRGSEYHGVVIGQEARLPFALVRSPNATYADGSEAPYRATLPLTGKQSFIKQILHYETKDGKWISDRFASKVRPARKMPGWAKRGEKWIDVNLTKQLITLYEGETPVYATLISSGEAGLEDHTSSTATKRGIFRIHTKHVTATMSSREIGEEFELQDVPYVMYFDKEGYALHGAYWHDRFGIPKSHGCINLAPEDARRIFHWADPPLPTGWHGVLEALKGTVVFVHQ